jgi:hypothetical protein
LPGCVNSMHRACFRASPGSPACCKTFTHRASTWAGAQLQSAYPEYMQHFLGWPGAKAALGLGALSDRAATLAVWATLQFELAFALPLYAVRLTVTPVR